MSKFCYILITASTIIIAIIGILAWYNKQQLNNYSYKLEQCEIRVKSISLNNSIIDFVNKKLQKDINETIPKIDVNGTILEF